MKGRGWEKVHDPAVLPQVRKLWQNAISSGEPFEMVYPLRRADGQFRSFLTRVEPVKDNQGQVVRWFGTNTDITDQQRTEEDLRRMNRELEEFAYVASHDLQEPLRMVNIYTQQILKTIGSDNEKLNLYSGFVQQGVTRMEALIRDLLTFSRSVHSEEAPSRNGRFRNLPGGSFLYSENPYRGNRRYDPGFAASLGARRHGPDGACLSERSFERAQVSQAELAPRNSCLRRAGPRPMDCFRA